MKFYTSLLNAIRTGTSDDAESIQASATQWLGSVNSCGDAGLRGFKKDRITPYGHLISTHAGVMVQKYGGIGDLSGQKLEAINDSWKIGYLRQTNCRDIHASIHIQKQREFALRAQAEQQHLEDAHKLPKSGCQV